MENSKRWRQVHLPEALAVLIIMLAIMGLGVIKFGLSPQTPVILVIALVILWARIRGAHWDDIHGGIVDGIKTGIMPIFIFLLIGALISVWIAAGIIPSMMVFGFNLISAKWFVPSVFLVCAIIGTSIGSAFTIISTIGIALFGIGSTMGIDPALVAGAIISGAIFGDKTSPLSDSTNLASAIAESDLFSHIRNLMWSTIPAFIVSLILYTVLGTGASTGNNLGKIQTTLTVLNQNFTISWWAALPLVVMLACALLKIPAIPTLLMNIGLAIVMIFIEQPHIALSKIAGMIETGFVAKTGNASVDALLSRGGISAMMGTVSLILLTLSLIQAQLLVTQVLT